MSQQDLSAVVDYRRPVSQGLNLVATMLTAGSWGIVWIVMAVARKSDRKRFSVDPYGHVWLKEGLGTA